MYCFHLTSIRHSKAECKRIFLSVSFNIIVSWLTINFKGINYEYYLSMPFPISFDSTAEVLILKLNYEYVK